MNIKKSILATVLLVGAAVPIVSLANNQKNISSGEQIIFSSSAPKADTEDKLVIWSPWTEGGKQDIALRAIVDTYNTHVESILSDTIRQVEVKTITTGYSGLTELVQQDIESGLINELPDMYINYADTTSTLISWGKDSKVGESLALDLTNQTATNNVESMIVPTLAKSNDLIAGGEEGAIYSIPFATSSEIMGIDVPTFVWMLEQYQNNGGKVEVSETETIVMPQIFDSADGKKDGEINYVLGTNNISEISPEDVTQIEKFWKNTGTNVTGSTLTIDENTFTSGEGMLALSTELLRVVDTTASGGLSSRSDQAIYGYDSAVNNFYTYGQAETNSLENPEAGLISKDGDDVNFNMIYEDNAAYDTAIDLVQYFEDAFAEGAVWVPNNGMSYGSDLIKNHQMPFSIGSTAGATYYFETDVANKSHLVNPDDVVYVQAPGKLSMTDDSNVQMQQGPVFGAVKQFNDSGKVIDEDRNESIAYFMNWLISDDTYTFDTTDSDYIKESTWDKGTTNYSEDGGTTFPLKGADFTLTSAQSEPAGMTPEDTYGSSYEYYNILGSDGKVLKGAENYFWQDSFYGFEVFKHDSATEPEVGTAIKYSIGGETVASPSIFMSEQSNYIVGTTTTFEDEEYKGKLEDPKLQWTDDNGKYENAGLIGPSIAYKNIQGSTTGDNELEVEPYNDSTSGFRSTVSFQIGNQKTNVVNGKKMDEPERVLANIHNEAVKSGWAEGNVILIWEWWMTLIIVLLALTVVGLIVGLIIYFVGKGKKNKEIKI